MKKKNGRKISASSMSNVGPSSVPALNVSTSGSTIAVSSTYNVSAISSIVSLTWKKEESGQSNSGYIFMRNNKTTPQCYQYRVFGLSASKAEVVKKSNLVQSSLYMILI